MASALYQSIELLSRDKGIDPEIVVGAVEDAIALATRKYYKTTENMRGDMDRETGEIRAYIYKTVVEGPEQIEDEINQLTLDAAREIAPEVEVGAELRFYKDTTPLGRIAAQMAKQVIFQKVREAERDTVFLEYNHRAGEIITATVKRLEPQDIIFDLGKAEARMPKREQSRLEQFAVGERVRVVLLRVDRAAKGPQVIVSRAAPALVQSLFQSEVPEIYDNTVTIRAIAREAGERTKIAVMSRDKDVDPVGACVGMKGMRVQSIIRELRGEKIDIIEFSEEVTTFAEKALQPAKVARVSITDLAEIVDDVLAFNALDGCVEDFFFAVRIFIEDGIALGFTHLLKDDLLGKLRGDAAEGAGVAIEANLAAHFNLGRQFDGVRQRDLVERVFYLFISCHDGLIDVSRNLAGLFVQLSAHVFLGLVIFARSEGNGFLDGSDDDAGVNAFFLA